MGRSILPIAVLAGVIAIAPAGFAKDDSDRGDKLVLIEKLGAVRITGLQDFVFPESLQTPPAMEDGVCVYSTQGGRYQVIATGGAGGFNLSSGAATIAYSVLWTDGAGGPPVALSSGQASPVFTGADRIHDRCNGATNAGLRISLDPTSFDQAPPGTYADTLTITITAN